MDKTYLHKTKEDEIYNLWQSNNLFSPEGAAKIRQANGKTFTILMAPPNANAPLHVGHALYSIQDLMVRFKRLQGYDALYLPGTDHAGFETQYVYESKLKKQGKTRFDFDRQTLYNDILNYVKENSDMAIKQLKKIGIGADWEKNTFMLDDKVINFVHETFIKMHKDGLIYRSGYMVNYSTYYGTTFSDLETEYKESISPLYYVRYKIVDREGNEDKNQPYIVIATVRPETIYADVAIAINPGNQKTAEFKGKYALNPLTGRIMPVIEDEYVDPEFGTGALKITPGHDHNDYKIGQKHKLEVISLIDLDGKLNHFAKECEGTFPKQARVKVAEILKNLDAIEKIDEKYTNNVLVDYKEGYPIEPMILPNWFVDTSTLFDPVIETVEKDEIKFTRDSWKFEMLRWLKEKKPWPISRQTVFGISIPIWYDINKNPDLVITFLDQKGAYKTGKIIDLLGEYRLGEIVHGLQKVIAKETAEYVVSVESPGIEFLPETDTFDTWFSSGQWPLTTTGCPNGEVYEKYYPTDFMDTAWEIIFFWIARMIMFSKFLTGNIPFKNVYIHGLVTDDKGVKMSKSKGNVVNPLDVVEEFSADALRFGLLVGGDTSARTTPVSIDKIRGYRNFANKIWNIARFLDIKEVNGKIDLTEIQNLLCSEGLKQEDKEILARLNKTIESVTNNLENYKFKLAGEALYHFIWDDLASKYLEQTKARADKEVLGVLKYSVLTSLKLLHPFMPFITEAVWQELFKSDKEPFLITANWPKVV